MRPVDKESVARILFGAQILCAAFAWEGPQIGYIVLDLNRESIYTKPLTSIKYSKDTHVKNNCADTC